MPYGQQGYGYGAPQSGGNYGLAYGLGEIGAQIPNALIRGEDIRRQRDQQDFERAKEKNAYDREMTAQQINDYAPDEEPPQVESSKITGYGMAGDDSGTTYSPADVAEGRNQLRGYTDKDGNLSEDVGAGKNINDVFTPKTETSKRDMNPYEKAAWMANKKASFALQKGRGDLAMSYMGEATKAHLQDRYSKVQNAVEFLKNGNMDQAKDLYNEIGDAGQIDNITQNDDGSYDFHTNKGIKTITSDQLDQSVQHAQQLTWDPKLQAQYVGNAQKGMYAQGRAETREHGIETQNTTKEKVANIAATAKITAAGGNNSTAIKVAQIRAANKGGGGSGAGKVTPSSILMSVAGDVARESGWDGKGAVPGSAIVEAKKRIAGAAETAKAEGAAEKNARLLWAVSNPGKPYPAQAKPAQAAPTTGRTEGTLGFAKNKATGKNDIPVVWRGGKWVDR